MPANEITSGHRSNPALQNPAISPEERLGIIVVLTVMLFVLAIGIGFAVYFGKHGCWSGVGLAVIGAIVIDGIILWAASAL